MSTAEIGEMLAAIGQNAADVLGKIPDDVFVYLRAGDQWMEGAIFDNVENAVIYHDPNEDMVKLVMRLWEAADPTKKWEMLHYDIKNGAFSVEYFYPEQLDPEEGSPDHRERALAKRYGEKKIIYPEPSPGNWHDLGAGDLPDDESPEA